MVASPEIARLAVHGAAIAYCRLPAWEATEYVSHSSASSVGLSFTHQRCVVEVAGRAAAREVHPVSVVVMGAGPATWLCVEEASEFIEVTGDASLRNAIADELCVPSASDLADVGYPGDAIAWAVAARLRAYAASDGPIDQLEVEFLVRRLYGHAFIARFGGRLRERSDGALDARRLARVAEFVDSHLGTDLNLGMLADIAALSPFHFQRSFRRATGCTPHRYVALRRAERARQQLAAGLPVAEVAPALGYKNNRGLRMALAKHLGDPLGEKQPKPIR